MEIVKKSGWGGKRPGQTGRPKKDKCNAKRQISVPPDLDEKIIRFAEMNGLSYSAAVVTIIRQLVKMD